MASISSIPINKHLNLQPHSPHCLPPASRPSSPASSCSLSSITSFHSESTVKPTPNSLSSKPRPSLPAKLNLQTRPDPRIFGPICGVLRGKQWSSRFEVSQAGVHAPPQAGISGCASQGAHSVAMGGSYPDGDGGDIIWYMGDGGGLKKLTRLPSKPLLTDQSQLSHGNQALLASLITRRPVRVIRGHGIHHSPWAPLSGYRYDGLYTVTRAAWMADPSGRTGFDCLVWRMERILYPAPDYKIPVRPGSELTAVKKAALARFQKEAEDASDRRADACPEDRLPPGTYIRPRPRDPNCSPAPGDSLFGTKRSANGPASSSSPKKPKLKITLRIPQAPRVASPPLLSLSPTQSPCLPRVPSPTTSHLPHRSSSPVPDLSAHPTCSAPCRVTLATKPFVNKRLDTHSSSQPSPSTRLAAPAKKVPLKYMASCSSSTSQKPFPDGIHPAQLCRLDSDRGSPLGISSVGSQWQTLNGPRSENPSKKPPSDGLHHATPHDSGGHHGSALQNSSSLASGRLASDPPRSSSSCRAPFSHVSQHTTPGGPAARLGSPDQNTSDPSEPQMRDTSRTSSQSRIPLPDGLHHTTPRGSDSHRGTGARNSSSVAGLERQVTDTSRLSSPDRKPLPDWLRPGTFCGSNSPGLARGPVNLARTMCSESRRTMGDCPPVSEHGSPGRAGLVPSSAARAQDPDSCPEKSMVPEQNLGPVDHHEAGRVDPPAASGQGPDSCRARSATLEPDTDNDIENSLVPLSTKLTAKSPHSSTALVTMTGDHSSCARSEAPELAPRPAGMEINTPVASPSAGADGEQAGLSQWEKIVLSCSQGIRAAEGEVSPSSYAVGGEEQVVELGEELEEDQRRRENPFDDGYQPSQCVIV